MNLDTDTIVALIGFLGLVVTTIGGVYVATKTNRSEKENTAEATLEQTKDAAYEARLAAKDGQIELRDDQIVDLKEDRRELEEELAKVRQDLIDCQANSRTTIAELEAENDQLGIENRRLKGLRKE